MTKKSIQAALESAFLHGSPFSADLLNNVLMNFIDELEESLHDMVEVNVDDAPGAGSPTIMPSTNLDDDGKPTMDIPKNPKI